MTCQLCLVRGVSVLFAHYTVIISTVMVSSLFFAFSTFPNKQWPAMFSSSRELASLPFACALLLGVQTRVHSGRCAIVRHRAGRKR